MDEVVTPGKFDGSKDHRFLREEKRDIHYLHEPNDWSSGMAWANLDYQMQYSVESLEGLFAERGNPHVLQLNLDWRDSDWQNPSAWRLYADSYEVAGDTDEYARQCFLKLNPDFEQISPNISPQGRNRKKAGQPNSTVDLLVYVVEMMGFEPTTPTLRTS